MKQRAWEVKRLPRLVPVINSWPTFAGDSLIVLSDQPVLLTLTLPIPPPALH